MFKSVTLEELDLFQWQQLITIFSQEKSTPFKAISCLYIIQKHVNIMLALVVTRNKINAKRNRITLHVDTLLQRNSSYLI